MINIVDACQIAMILMMLRFLGIQGDFGKLIDDLIQKCYYENNPYDE